MVVERCEFLCGSQGQQNFVVTVEEAIIMNIFSVKQAIQVESFLLWTLQPMHVSRTARVILQVHTVYSAEDTASGWRPLF